MNEITEDADMGDWLKIPSELIISAGLPMSITPAQLLMWMRDQGMAETPLYRRIDSDPYFEKRMGGSWPQD